MCVYACVHACVCVKQTQQLVGKHDTAVVGPYYHSYQSDVTGGEGHCCLGYCCRLSRDNSLKGRDLYLSFCCWEGKTKLGERMTSFVKLKVNQMMDKGNFFPNFIKHFIK